MLVLTDFGLSKQLCQDLDFQQTFPKTILKVTSHLAAMIN